LKVEEMPFNLADSRGHAGRIQSYGVPKHCAALLGGGHDGGLHQPMPVYTPRGGAQGRTALADDAAPGGGPRWVADVPPPQPWRTHMASLNNITEHMDVIGADGVHVGTVDKVEDGRIKLVKDDAGEGHHKGHHHYIPGNLVADIEDGAVRLSANAD